MAGEVRVEFGIRNTSVKRKLESDVCSSECFSNEDLLQDLQPGFHEIVCSADTSCVDLSCHKRVAGSNSTHTLVGMRAHNGTSADSANADAGRIDDIVDSDSYDSDNSCCTCVSYVG